MMEASCGDDKIVQCLVAGAMLQASAADRSCEPDHYLFSFRDRRQNAYVPSQAPSRWVFRRSWDKLRDVTGFKELRPHDLRHHCITRLLENEVNEQTVIAIAGHAGKRMLEYYAHQRKRVKYEAVMAIDPNQAKVSKKKAPAPERGRYARRHNARIAGVLDFAAERDRHESLRTVAPFR